MASRRIATLCLWRISNWKTSEHIGKEAPFLPFPALMRSLRMHDPLSHDMISGHAPQSFPPEMYYSPVGAAGTASGSDPSYWYDMRELGYATRLPNSRGSLPAASCRNITDFILC